MRVAGVGAGYFSQFHYASWAAIGRVDVVGACDLNLEAARATGLPAFSDLRVMLDQTKPDLLDIILPPAGHAWAIRTALQAGVKHMICQKPFCRDLDEAERITKEVSDAGGVVVIHENFRFQPWYRRIKQALDDGGIGHVLQATFRLRPGDGQGPEAYLDRQPYFQQMPQFLIHETGVHWIDTFCFLFGAPTAIYADLRRVNPVLAGEDAGYVVFDHPGGIRAVLDANRSLDHAADNPRRTMGEALIEGTTGTLSLTGDGAVHLRAFGAQELQQILPPDTWDGFGGNCVHGLQLHVVSGLLEGTEIENTAEAYLRVIRIKDAIYASAETGQKQVLSV